MPGIVRYAGYQPGKATGELGNPSAGLLGFGNVQAKTCILFEQVAFERVVGNDAYWAHAFLGPTSCPETGGASRCSTSLDWETLRGRFCAVRTTLTVLLIGSCKTPARGAPPSVPAQTASWSSLAILESFAPHGWNTWGA